MPLVKVENTDFVRDTNSMVLINTNENAKQEYYNKVQVLQNQKQEINTVKQEIAGIKNDMDEIKQLMLKLLEKG
jgi:hypothetical protein